jgi:hypothetical protein
LANPSDANKVVSVKHMVGAADTLIVDAGGFTIEGAATQILVGHNGSGSPVFGHAKTFYRSSDLTDWKILSEYLPPRAHLRNVAADRTWDETEAYEIYSVDLGGGGADITITLAAAMPHGRTLTVKDMLGMANVIPAPFGQKIVIADAGGGTFDGAATLNITSAYGSATVFKNGSGNWSVI